ncbi:MAG: hypothetical protein JXB49_33610 [Bacteroidales bacterium]|nr:hypothetical protein [Bacteroidales bacterium]
MQRKITLLVLLLSCFPLMAQYTYFGFREGLGFYSMKSLDHLQELRCEESGFPMETTESYPASMNHHFEVGEYLPSFISKWAICYRYCSTGARSTVSDYSGRYDLDAVITGHQLGLMLEHVFPTASNLGYGTYLEAGSVYTRLKTLDFFNLTFPVSVTYKAAYDFIAFGGYGELGLFVHYKYRFVMARLNLGYLFDIMAPLHLKDNREMQLYLENRKLRPQWDGLRMGLQVNILLRNPEKTN